LKKTEAHDDAIGLVLVQPLQVQKLNKCSSLTISSANNEHGFGFVIYMIF